jgi:hypothetical protein
MGCYRKCVGRKVSKVNREKKKKKVCCLEVVLFTLSLGFKICLSTMSFVIVHKDEDLVNFQVL